MKLDEKDIQKLERVMSKHRIASVDELIAVIERGHRFGKHAGGRPRTITSEKRQQILDEKARGATLQAVADRHGVSVSTVKKIIREHKERQQPAAPWEKSEAARRMEAAAVKMRLYEYINEQKAVKEDERELARIIRCDAYELVEAIKSLEGEEVINVSRSLVGEVDTGYMVYYLATKKI